MPTTTPQQQNEDTAVRNDTQDSHTDGGGTQREALRDRILAERKAGNIVFWGLPGELMAAKLDEFVKQPAEGMLYDLNRLEEISLTFLNDPKWVNDFAVALTIRKLVEQREALESELTASRERAEGLAGLLKRDMSFVQDECERRKLRDEIDAALHKEQP